MQKTDIKIIKIIIASFSSLGSFLGGLAAILAVVWSKNAFQEYRQKSKSKAAPNIKSSVAQYIAQVEEILPSIHLYQYKTGDTNEDPGRPAALLKEAMDLCKNQIIDSLRPMTGREYDQLQQLSKELEKQNKTLIGFSNAHLDVHNPKSRLNYKGSTEYIEELKKIEQRFRDILEPIIEDKKKPNK